MMDLANEFCNQASNGTVDFGPLGIDYTYFVKCTMEHWPVVASEILLVWLILLFWLLASTADAYLSPTLSTICEKLNISYDVAGITFLAFGNGSPDVFSSIAAFASQAPVTGASALLGGACCVTTLVVGVVALACEPLVRAEAFIRDVLFLQGACCLLLLVHFLGFLNIYVAGAFLLLYLTYVVTAVGGDVLRRQKRRLSRGKRDRERKKEGKTYILSTASAPSPPTSPSSFGEPASSDDGSDTDRKLGEEVDIEEAARPVAATNDRVCRPVDEAGEEEVDEEPTAFWHQDARSDSNSMAYLSSENQRTGDSVKDGPWRFQGRDRRHSEGESNVCEVGGHRYEFITQKPPPLLAALRASPLAVYAEALRTSASRKQPLDLNDVEEDGRDCESSSYTTSSLSFSAPIFSEYFHHSGARGEQEDHASYAATQWEALLASQKPSEELSESLLDRSSRAQLEEEYGHSLGEGEGSSWANTALFIEKLRQEASNREQGEEGGAGRSRSGRRLGRGASVGEKLIDGLYWSYRRWRSDAQRRHYEFWKETHPLKKVLLALTSPFLLLREVSIPLYDEGSWWRLRAALYPIFAPLYLLFSMGMLGAHIAGKGPPLWFIALLFGLLVSPFIFFNTHRKKMPKGAFFSFCMLSSGFIMCIAWVYTVASELVALISSVASLTGMSHSLVALTVLSWGNSVGDLVTDTAVAKAGFGEMAIAGCFGGPLFNVLVGFGFSVFLSSLAEGPTKKIPFQLDSHALLSVLFIMVTLTGTLYAIRKNDYVVSSRVGVVLIAMYTAFCAFNVFNAVKEGQ